MFNKFSRVLTLSTTLLSIGLASSSATFAKTTLNADQLLKFAQLSQYFKVSVGQNIQTVGEIAHKYRGKQGTTIDFSKTLGGDAGDGLGEINLSATDGLGNQPPVVARAVFNLSGSDTSALEVAKDATGVELYDSEKDTSYSALVLKVSEGATGIEGIDKTYVIIPLYHGKFTDTNLQQSADLSSSLKTKCFTNMKALEEFSNFDGDNTSLERKGLLTSENILELKEMSKFLGNCQRVDVNLDLVTGAKFEAVDEAPGFIKPGTAADKSVINKITLKYVN